MSTTSTTAAATGVARTRPGASPATVELAVVAPTGVLDEGVLDELDELIATTPTTPVVIDLTDCVLASPATVAALDTRRWARQDGDVCIVCRRLTGRRLLFHAGVALPVFGSVQDASQALVLGDAGFGRGWR